jgi:hypothetical protein
MKPREPRKKVMIKARMRVGAAWQDACILDMSTRGLMIQAPDPLPGGSYLELRRGRHVIIARVVWSRDRRAGLRAQEVLPTEAIIAEPDHSTGPPIVAGVERRAEPLARVKAVPQHEHSRWRSRAWEFASIAFLGGAFATFAYGAVASALERPLVAVEGALGGE